MLFVAKMKITIQIFLNCQWLTRDFTGNVEWLGMVKKLHLSGGHVFYRAAKLGGFASACFRFHSMKFTQAASYDHPEFVLPIIGNGLRRTHAICTFPLAFSTAIACGVWNEI